MAKMGTQDSHYSVKKSRIAILMRVRGESRSLSSISTSVWILKYITQIGAGDLHLLEDFGRVRG